MGTLKKISLILIVVLIFSCNKKETTTQLSSSDLIGSWNLIDFYTENGAVSLNFNGLPISGTYKATGSNFDFQVIFSDNPKNITQSGNFTITTTVNILGQTQTDEQILDQIPTLNGSWAYQDNTLSITEQNTTIDAEVLNFDGNLLELKATLDDNFIINNQTATLEGNLFITLRK